MKRSVVIADDNTALTCNLKEFFAARQDYEVVGIAANGAEALALVEQFSPDFLLLDIVMPEIDGFGVLSALNSPSTTVISGTSYRYSASSRPSASVVWSWVTDSWMV